MKELRVRLRDHSWHLQLQVGPQLRQSVLRRGLNYQLFNTQKPLGKLLVNCWTTFDFLYKANIHACALLRQRCIPCHQDNYLRKYIKGRQGNLMNPIRELVIAGMGAKWLIPRNILPKFYRLCAVHLSKHVLIETWVTFGLNWCQSRQPDVICS